MAPRGFALAAVRRSSAIALVRVDSTGGATGTAAEARSRLGPAAGVSLAAGTPPKTALTVFGCAPRIPADLNPRTVAASAAVVPPTTALAVAAASLSRSRAAYRSLRSRRSAPTGTGAFESGASGMIVALLAEVAMVEAVDGAAASGASSPSFALHQNRCPSLQAVLWHSLPQYFAFRHRRHLANSRGYSSQRPQSTEGKEISTRFTGGK